MATIQSDESGVVERVNIAPEIVEKYRDRADEAHTVEVDPSTNRDLLKTILNVCQTDQNDYTIIGGVLRQGGNDVSLGAESDAAAIRKLAGNLTLRELNGLRAGAKAFLAGLSESSSDSDKALGLVIVWLLRLGGVD